MTPGRAILLYAVAIIVVGALLAPWAYTWLIHPFWPNIPFRRVFNRTLLVVALIGLWPLLRSLQLRSREAIGLPGRAGAGRELLIGFVAGLVSLAGGGLLLLLLGVRVLDTSAALTQIMLKALLTGIVVSLIEEIFFRAGVFGAFRRAMALWPAILTSSAIYSVLHFLKPKGVKMDTVTWLSGFDHLGQVLTKSFAVPGVLIGFITLLLAGCILAIAFVRSKALYLSIGLHAGWVFALKTFSAMTDAAGPRRWWGGASLVDNMLVWPLLLILLVLVWRYKSPS